MNLKKGIIPALVLSMTVSGMVAAAQENEDDRIASLYEGVIQKYIEGITAGWDFYTFTENGLCYLAAYDDSPEDVGYYLEDVDQDGVEELIIGGNNTGYVGMFYDLYTVADGELKRVATSGERDRFYLCIDQTIANEGSGGAMLSGNRYYDFSGAQLSLKEMVFYDGSYDADNPWFYNTVDQMSDYTHPLSEDEAVSIIDSYTYKDIPYTPFSQFTGSLSGSVSSDSEGVTGTADLERLAGTADSENMASGSDTEEQTVQQVCSLRNLPYIGQRRYELQLSCMNQRHILNCPEDTSGVIGVVKRDFDMDGQTEIFAVTHEPSTILGAGKSSIHFLFLRQQDGSWQVTAETEVLTRDVDGVYQDMSGMEEGVTDFDGSVFFRIYEGQLQFFFESFEVGVLATGVNWELAGYRLDENGFTQMEETAEIGYTGSEFSLEWPQSEEERKYFAEECEMIDRYRALGFTITQISTGSLTADQNSGTYQVARMTRGNDLTQDQLNGWQQNNVQPQSGFWYEFEDTSGEVPDELQEFAATKIDGAANGAGASGGTVNGAGTTDSSTVNGAGIAIDGGTSAAEYIFPDSDARYLDESDIASMSTEEIQRAVNELYARHGRVFTKAENDSYFRSRSWYQPDPDKTDDAILAEFNEYENYNLKFLAGYL